MGLREVCGFVRSPLPTGVWDALGSDELTPREMTTAYGVLANGGNRGAHWFIERVTRGSDDNGLDEARPAIACRSCDAGQTEVVIDGRTYDVAPRVADPTAVYILRDMLRDVIESGTGRAALSLNRNDGVGKTRTPNTQRDGWFAGYNDDLVDTAWIGKDNTETIAEYGGNAALPIWIDFMGNALNGRPEARPEPPAGLITARVDAQTGRRLADGQPGGITEIFHPDYLPDMEPRRVEQEIEQRSGSQGTGSYEAIF